MADDTLAGWDAQIAALENLADNIETIERKALLSAARAVAPELEAAAPSRIDPERAGGYVPPAGKLTFKGAVRARAVKDKATGKLQAVVDFGKWLTWLAHIVDIGHNPPHTRLAKKLGRENELGKPTPPHPFIRGVQDSCQKLAQDTFQQAMTEGINAALQGKK